MCGRVNGAVKTSTPRQSGAAQTTRPLAPLGGMLRTQFLVALVTNFRPPAPPPLIHQLSMVFLYLTNASCSARARSADEYEIKTSSATDRYRSLSLFSVIRGFSRGGITGTIRSWRIRRTLYLTNVGRLYTPLDSVKASLPACEEGRQPAHPLRFVDAFSSSCRRNRLDGGRPRKGLDISIDHGLLIVLASAIVWIPIHAIVSHKLH